MSRAKPQPPAPSAQAKKTGGWFKPAAIGVGVLVFMAGLMTFSAGVSAAPSEKSHQDFVTGLIELGGAVGLVALALGWFDPAPPDSGAKADVFYTVVVLAAFGMAQFVSHCGMHQIGGFDHSVLVDVGWRLYNGQTAYVDFPCTLPVGFILGAKFAFQWFGVYWRSLIDITALFAMVTFAWSLFLLVELFGRRWPTLLWAVALQAISVMLVSYWWYNPVTAVTAVLYVLSATYWLHRPGDRRALVSYSVALLAVATVKPNVAGVIVLPVSIVLFLSPRLRWKTLFVSAGAFLAFLLFLTINHLSLTGMVKGYLSVAERGASFKQFLQDLSPVAQRAALAAAAIVVLPLAVVLYQGRRALLSRRPLVALIAVAGGLYGFITNGEQKLVDMPLVLFGAILLVAELRCPSIPESGPVFSLPGGWNRYLTWVCLVLAAGGIAQGLGRDRIKAIGPSLFFEYDDSKHVLESGFFRGLHSGEIFFELNRELEEVVRREGSKAVWFGPRIQWAYAAYGKPSPRQQPIWWHPGVSFAAADADTYFDRLMESRPEVLVCIKNDVYSYTQDPMQLLPPETFARVAGIGWAYYTQDRLYRLSKQYTVDQSFPILTIWRLKK